MVMTTHGSAAKMVRENKEAHPENYCRVARCLWRTGGPTGSPCRNHPVATPAPAAKPAVGMTVVYSRPGSPRYEGMVVTGDACEDAGCRARLVHVRTDDGGLHHVPVETIKEVR